MKNACVILTDQTGQAINFSYAELSGHFTLSKIPLGSYKLQAEIPGKYSEILDITLSNNQPSISSIVLEVYENNIHGIKENSDDIMVGNVYPNPADDQINISVNNTRSKQLKVSVYDITGRKCIEKTIIWNKENIPIALKVGHLKQGIYLLNIFSADGNILITRKFVK